jgi:hypothetical protein
MTNKKLEAQKKVQEAIEAKAKAIQALNLAMKDSVQLIKEDMKETTNTYEKNIEEFKAKASYEANEIQIITAKKVAELEQKNDAMIMRLSNYQDTTQVSESFELFRYELGRELSEEGKSLKTFKSNI